MSRKIYIYDEDSKKWVEANKVPPKFDDSRNYVNMRKTWSNQTKVEFNHTTMDKDIAQRNNR